MAISGFGDSTLEAELALFAIGLPALLIGYFGVLIFNLPSTGRPLSVAFTRAIPLSIVAWLIAVLAVGVETERLATSSERTCHLSANYSLMVVDQEGSGWVYNRKNENRRGGVNWQRDGIDGVEILQISGRYILGGRDSQGFRPSRSHALINEYFLIDSERETVARFSTLEQLQSSAAQLGISVQLRPVYEVYSSCGESQPATDNAPQRTVIGAIYFLCIGFVGLLVWWGMTLWRLRATFRLS
jgi:hypothetical protein